MIAITTNNYLKTIKEKKTKTWTSKAAEIDLSESLISISQQESSSKFEMTQVKQKKLIIDMGYVIGE